MAEQKKVNNGGLEWKINIKDGSSKILVEESSSSSSSSSSSFLGLGKRIFVGPKCLIQKIGKFLGNAKEVGVNDPRKVVHGLKVGLILSIVTLFYYMRPLYEGVGGNAMWAIMTVVVVLENTVGATIMKSLNRICGTCLAGMFAFSIHWLASKSGQKFEHFILGISIFLIASSATFARFVPSVKKRFDYGTMIFILTFSLIAVSGYRVDQLFELAYQRISTIIIGTSICIFSTLLICPIWAGQELHTQLTNNMDKLAISLDSCASEYFSNNENNKQPDKHLFGYKCILNSKATEESMANFAIWEPAHGCFSFKHPWNQYPKIGALLRNCACCIEALTSCIDSENQAPESIKKKLANVGLKVASNSSKVIKELSKTIKKMERSSNLNFLIEEMDDAVGVLQEALISLTNLVNSPEIKTFDTDSETVEKIQLSEVIPAVIFGSLLVEIGIRIKKSVKEVDELAKLAEFKVQCEVKGVESINALQKV